MVLTKPPSGSRGPARTRPLLLSKTSPIAFTAKRAPTTMPEGVASLALPMPPFRASRMPSALATVAPVPAPTLPSCGFVSLAASQAA